MVGSLGLDAWRLDLSAERERSPTTAALPNPTKPTACRRETESLATCWLVDSLGVYVTVTRRRMRHGVRTFESG
jgi:hypothetical protein